jgi:hypothetical protein
MRKTISAAILAAAALTAGVATTDVAAADVVLAPEAREPPIPLALTVYGDGWALVWDRRAASLAAGANRLAFEGVSRQMLPSSAMIRAGAGVRLLDVDYDFALLTPDALLRRSVGKSIGVARLHPTTGERIVEAGTLLSAEDGVLVRLGDRIEAVDPARLVFAEAPADLRPQPTLLATVDSAAAGRTAVTLGYLSRGLGWNADYVALWDEAAGRLDLTGRATLANTSGADYPDADVSLIAGSVNREPASSPERVVMGRAKAAPMMTEAAATPVRQAVADLHLYKMPGRVSLLERQTKQVTLLTLAGLPVTQEYVSEAPLVFFRQGGEPQPTHPQVRLRFEDKRPDGAGEPLPAGIVRVYASAADGLPRLVGEDRIEHTPAGAPVTLAPGEAFDLTVLRRQTDFVRKGPGEQTAETAWAIEARNARDKPAVVKIVEVIPGDWSILAESAPHEKESAERIAWRLTVPARGTAQLTYRALVRQ